MSKIRGYLRLMRVANCLMMGFAVEVGAVLATSNLLELSMLRLFYGFVAGFMLTAASMSMNDYYDREIDAVNEPNRPIPSGLVKPREALVFAFFITAAGFLAAYLTSIICFAVAIIAWAIFVAYTTVGKRSGLPGNFLVSACVAVPFIFGSVVVSNAVEQNVLIFASIAFLSNTGREITKGIVDVKGDKMQGVKTLAVRHGERNAAVVATILYLLAVIFSPIPWFLNLVFIGFVPLVVIADVGLVASSIMLLKDCSRENARRVKNQVLIWLLVGLIAFAVGSLE